MSIIRDRRYPGRRKGLSFAVDYSFRIDTSFGKRFPSLSFLRFGLNQLYTSDTESSYPCLPSARETCVALMQNVSSPLIVSANLALRGSSIPSVDCTFTIMLYSSERKKLTSSSGQNPFVRRANFFLAPVSKPPVMAFPNDVPPMRLQEFPPDTEMSVKEFRSVETQHGKTYVLTVDGGKRVWANTAVKKFIDASSPSVPFKMTTRERKTFSPKNSTKVLEFIPVECSC